MAGAALYIALDAGPAKVADAAAHSCTAGAAVRRKAVARAALYIALDACPACVAGAAPIAACRPCPVAGTVPSAYLAKPPAMMSSSGRCA